MGPEALTPIRFESNTDTMVVTGRSPEGRRNAYTFEAAAGQTARIAITSTTDAVNFALIGPDGSTLKSSESDERQGDYFMVEAGTYTVGLASPRPGIGYSLRLTIPPT